MQGYRVDGVRAAQARMALTGGDGRSLGQAAAARELLGINPVTLNRVENGKANVSLDLLERMAALYGVSKAWLLGEPDEIDAIEAAQDALAASTKALNENLQRAGDLVKALDRRLRETIDREATPA